MTTGYIEYLSMLYNKPIKDILGDKTHISFDDEELNMYGSIIYGDGTPLFVMWYGNGTSSAVKYIDERLGPNYHIGEWGGGNGHYNGTVKKRE